MDKKTQTYYPNSFMFAIGFDNNKNNHHQSNIQICAFKRFAEMDFEKSD